METYQIEFELTSGYITDWQSDTILGAICWQMKYLYGESFLKDWLDKYRQDEPPLIVSNGLMNNWFPKPIVPDVKLNNESIEIQIKNLQKRKIEKKLTHLPFEIFEKIRNGEIVDVTGVSMQKKISSLVTQNQISRVTNQVNEGDLYSNVVKYLESDARIIIYAYINEEFLNQVKEAFNNLGIMGYGKKASTGKGSFIVRKFRRYERFRVIEEANGFVSLSNFVPRDCDPTKGYYDLITKYGKLGREFANLEVPFKRPILMIKAGSVFRDDTIKKYYGSCIENINPNTDIVHLAYAFVLPIKIRG